MKGIVLYRGPSVLDGSNIVAIATLASKNLKTGNMIQTWILSDEGEKPSDAVKSGKDEAVCGKCPHRHFTGGGCYVVLMHAPNKIYNSYVQGNYHDLSDETMYMFSGRRIRIGSYGDPAAVPFEVWQSIATVSDGLTGYTHQIGHPNFDTRLLEYCMVSADTPNSAAAHHRHGRRTFRVLPDDSAPLLDNEIMCPADPNKGISCINCGMCDGAAKAGSNIAIVAHGMRSKRVGERLPVRDIS